MSRALTILQRFTRRSPRASRRKAGAGWGRRPGAGSRHSGCRSATGPRPKRTSRWRWSRWRERFERYRTDSPDVERPTMHRETHRGERVGWLRAAVLGANDGLISTSSLVVGVAAADLAGRRSCWRRSRASRPGLSRWPPGSTSRSAPRRTPSRRTSPASAASSRRRQRQSRPSWRGSTAVAAESRAGRAGGGATDGP